MHRIAALLALAVLTGCRTAAPPIWDGLQPGSHHVGFRTEKLTSPPHVLPVSVWYPARRGGRALTFGDAAEVPDYAAVLTGNGVPEGAAQKLVAQPLAAHEGAVSDPGRYPLILVAQGNGQWALHQAVLSEFLASHGFIVVTVPSITRLAGPMQSDADVAPAISAQTDDLQRALAFAMTLPNIDRTHIVAVGHSFGARAALLFAVRQQVSAIVSLDGGIGTETANAGLPRIASPLPPIMHVYEERDRERLHTDLTFLRSLPTRELRVEKLENASHIHFTSVGFAAASDPAIAAATGALPGLREDVVKMARLVLEFAVKHTK